MAEMNRNIMGWRDAEEIDLRKGNETFRAVQCRVIVREGILGGHA